MMALYSEAVSLALKHNLYDIAKECANRPDNPEI